MTIKDSESGQPTSDSQRKSAGLSTTSTPGHKVTDTQADRVGCGPILADPTLAIAADIVDDLERVRIANENRLRQLTATGEHGHGMPSDHPDIVRLSLLTGAICDLEKQTVKNLEKVMHRHPLWKWGEPITGLGAKQFARLLQSIRDPYWNDLHDRPRTVSELWAYCGYHVLHPTGHPALGAQDPVTGGVAPKRTRGVKSNWNETARMRCHLIAESLMKEPGRTWPMPEGSPPANRHYRRVYEATRDKYAEAVHQTTCVRCGPSGHPALPGSPLSPGHQHANGLRIIAKELLKDLWHEARYIHETQGE
jgi:hypothetical protein